MPTAHNRNPAAFTALKALSIPTNDPHVPLADTVDDDLLVQIEPGRGSTFAPIIADTPDNLESIRVLLEDAGFIAMNSHAMTGDRDRLLAAGCDGYIEKPIDADRIINEIQAYLRRRQS